MTTVTVSLSDEVRERIRRTSDELLAHADGIVQREMQRMADDIQQKMAAELDEHNRRWTTGPFPAENMGRGFNEFGGKVKTEEVEPGVYRHTFTMRTLTDDSSSAIDGDYRVVKSEVKP